MYGPPPASSWAAPPEFYFDENAVTRSVLKFLIDLGYRCHTPAELFGTRDSALGVRDEVWLTRVREHDWVVLSRDAKIMERPAELAAYRAANVHMFYLPGEATRAQLLELISANLRDIITYASAKKPNVWQIKRTGVSLFSPKRAPRKRS